MSVNKCAYEPAFGSFISKRVRKAADLFREYLSSIQRILDVGCGVGDITLYLQEALGAQQVFGIEIVDSQVEKARQKGILALKCDLDRDRLPFNDDYFDAIFAGEVIEHLLNPDQFLDEVKRVLSRTGIFVLTTPNLASWFNRIALLLGWQPLGTATSYSGIDFGQPRFLQVKGITKELGGRHRLYTKKALKEFLEFKGFKVVKICGSTYAPRERAEDVKQGLVAPLWAYYPLIALNELLSNLSSLAHILVIAAKKE